MMGQRGVVLFCLSIIRSVRLGRFASDPTDPFDAHKERRSWQKALQRNRWSRIVGCFRFGNACCASRRRISAV